MLVWTNSLVAPTAPIALRPRQKFSLRLTRVLDQCRLLRKSLEVVNALGHVITLNLYLFDYSLVLRNIPIVFVILVILVFPSSSQVQIWVSWWAHEQVGPLQSTRTPFWNNLALFGFLLSISQMLISLGRNASDGPAPQRPPRGFSRFFLLGSLLKLSPSWLVGRS